LLFEQVLINTASMLPSAALEEMKSEAEPKSAFSLFVNQVTAGTQEAKGQNYGEPIIPSLLLIKL
jgi:hypothetical protein